MLGLKLSLGTSEKDKRFSVLLGKFFEASVVESGVCDRLMMLAGGGVLVCICEAEGVVGIEEGSKAIGAVWLRVGFRGFDVGLALLLAPAPDEVGALSLALLEFLLNAFSRSLNKSNEPPLLSLVPEMDRLSVDLVADEPAAF